jgi:hypothetical protein
MAQGEKSCAIFISRSCDQKLELLGCGDTVRNPVNT